MSSDTFLRQQEQQLLLLLKMLTGRRGASPLCFTIQVTLINTTKLLPIQSDLVSVSLTIAVPKAFTIPVLVRGEAVRGIFFAISAARCFPATATPRHQVARTRGPGPMR
eukprot:COSAG06_NODE_801_length_12195_cov_106.299934_2_plen_109_part_00